MFCGLFVNCHFMFFAFCIRFYIFAYIFKKILCILRYFSLNMLQIFFFTLSLYIIYPSRRFLKFFI